MDPLARLHSLGQSIWLDYIHRDLLHDGGLARMIAESGVTGVTSNPTIFEKALSSGGAYDADIARLRAKSPAASPRDLFFSLAVDDIQAAADLLLPVYRQTAGRDGMISLEVSPDLAYEAAGTIAEARRLYERVNRPNVMIKVPATREGIAAVEVLIGDGINVNVTLLFSLSRYEAAAEAYMSGLEARLRRGQAVHQTSSVASLFVSRVDTAVDTLLGAAMTGVEGLQRARLQALQGKAAIANAQLAYHAYKRLFGSPRFQALQAAGAQTQRLLWASTATKSPAYSDVLYVDGLIGPDTVNTIPPATLQAYRDHGRPAVTLPQDPAQAQAVMHELRETAGIDFAAVAERLEMEGVKLFAASFERLLRAVAQKAQEVTAPA